MNKAAKKILVVEDEDTLRDMFVLVLEDEGYKVDSASNGCEAWDLLDEYAYDLLATDLFMPKMNGIELIMACQSVFQKTKIILLNGGGKEIDAEHGKKHVKYMDQEISIDMFLKKPCSLNEMLMIIEKLLSE